MCLWHFMRAASLQESRFHDKYIFQLACSGIQPLALVCIYAFGLMTLLWVWILKQAPLHLAYPFMGLAFLLVPVFARIFLNEPLSLQTIGGGILIMLGIALASAGAHN